MLTVKMIKNAYKNIFKYINVTKLEKSNSFDNIYFKFENEQKLNCAKIRGAFNSLICNLDKKLPIVTVSSGNHGLSIAYASNILNLKDVSIFIPENISKNKYEKIKSYGVNVIKAGKDYDNAYELAMNYSKKKKCYFIDPCSDKFALAGQGTIAIEILKQLREIDNVFIPLGGGGIITGNALYIKKYAPHIKIIGVSSEKSPAMLQSLKDNIWYKKYDTENSICEALIGGVGKLPYQLAKDVIDEIVLVDEKHILKAIKHLLINEKTLTEPSAAISLAYYFQNPSYFENKKNLIVLTGANIDEKLIKEALKKE